MGQLVERNVTRAQQLCDPRRTPERARCVDQAGPCITRLKGATLSARGSHTVTRSADGPPADQKTNAVASIASYSLWVRDLVVREDPTLLTLL